MTQVAVLSSDERLLDLLRTSGLKPTRINTATLESYAQGGDAPGVLVVDVRQDGQIPNSLAAFRKRHPSAGAVLVMAALDPRLMLDAMRAGVTECVHEPLTAQAFDDAVRRVLTNTTAERLGQVFAFIGAKGGVGTTTVAVNTAAALGKIASGNVLLVDLHTMQGDGALFLGAEPRFSIVDALENVQKVDESFFSGLVEKTSAGIDLLAAPTQPRHVPVDGRRVRALLESASRMYATTVLDVPRSDVAMLDALDKVTTVVVVTSQELASLRNAAALAEALRHRYGGTRVKVIVNRYHKESAIPHADVERAVGSSVKHLLPSDYHMAIDALNSGRPFAIDGEGKLASAMRAFSRELAGIQKQKAERSQGVLGRLAWRRA